MPKNKLDIVIHGRRPSVLSDARIRKILRATATKLKKDGIVGVSFVPPPEMRRLNRTYHGKAGLTDVLSFSYIERPKKSIEGDIAICPSYVRVQASKQEVPYLEELARLLIHGFLHLSGYDHRTLFEEKRMFSLQERILSRL